jgi:WD40 repeat protein
MKTISFFGKSTAINNLALGLTFWAICIGYLALNFKVENRISERKLQTNQVVSKILKGHNSWVYAVAKSPDGKTFASSAYNKKIIIWEVSTGKELFTLEGHADAVVSLAFSPDGKFLAGSGWDNEITIWDLATGKVIREIKDNSDDIEAIAFSPDGKMLVSAGEDKTLKLWSTSNWTLINQIKLQTQVQSLAISPDGKLLAAGDESGKVMIFEFDPFGTLRLLVPLWAHDQAVCSLAFSRDGSTLATGSLDRTIKLWNRSGQVIRTLTGHNRGVLTVAFSSDGKTLATSGYDTTIDLWDWQTGQLQQRLSGHSRAVWSLDFSADSTTLISGSSDRTVRLWQLPTPVSQSSVSKSPKSSFTLTELAATLVQTPETTEGDLKSLTRKLYDQIDPLWKNRSPLEQDLVYRVGTDHTGAVLAVQQHSDLEQAEINDLFLSLAHRAPHPKEAIAHFRVVFTRNGILEVSPWRGY